MFNIKRRLAAVLVTIARRLLPVFCRLVPQGNIIVVSNSPENEGNGLEVARALLGRYRGKIVWLRAGGPVPVQVQQLQQEGLHIVSRSHPAGVWAYLRSRAVFFTHGLYGSPRPIAKKPIINLWHGDGPKDISPDKGVGGVAASTWFVGSTELFSVEQAKAFALPRSRVLLTGNARTDQFWQTPGSPMLEGLELPERFVLWLPTFRQTRTVGSMRSISEIAEVRDEVDSAQQACMQALVRACKARNLELLVKAHPLDAQSRSFSGARVITDLQLSRSGVGLYQLLSLSQGLVTDYSSVWVDYLLLNRPIAFLVPDKDVYTRALYPKDVFDWVPGEVVTNERPFERFFSDIDNANVEESITRKAVMDRIGLNVTHTAADDLLSELEYVGVLKLLQAEDLFSATRDGSI